MRDTTPNKTIIVFTPDLLSVQDAARLLGKPRSTAYRWIHSGHLLTIRLGGVLFVPTSEVERLLAGMKAPE